MVQQSGGHWPFPYSIVAGNHNGWKLPESFSLTPTHVTQLLAFSYYSVLGCLKMDTKQRSFWNWISFRRV